MARVEHPVKAFECEVEGEKYTGSVSRSGGELHDYIVKCAHASGEGGVYKFDVILVSTPLKYCVNTIRYKSVLDVKEQVKYLTPSDSLPVEEAFEFGMNAVHQLIKEQRESR